MSTHIKKLAPRSIGLILVIAVLFFAGISITGVAAQSSIPGDALYPVKTSIEQTRLKLAQDAGSRAQMKMGFAEQRLEEIAALVAEGRYREISKAVLAFEADINSAILELETVSQIDPARAVRIAREITAALTRYAQTLSAIAASAPDSVKPEVTRALETTNIAGGLPLPVDAGDDNGNVNANDNGDDNGNDANDNGDDNGNDANDNGDDNGNDANDNGDDNGNDANDNGDDNGNDANDNGDDNGNDANGNGDDNGNDANDNDDDNGNDNNGNGDNGNDNGNGDNGNDNGNGDNGNDNGNGANGNGDDSGNSNTNDDSRGGRGNSNDNDNGDD